MNKEYCELINNIEKHIDSCLRSVNDENNIYVLKHDVEWHCEQITAILDRLRSIPNE